MGAPLIARELEAGTYRLAWTQSVTRARWIATRLTLVTLVTAVLMGVLSTAVTWWQRPLDLVNDALWLNFDQRDVVPVAFAVFAVALGALLGALVRRTLVAMASHHRGLLRRALPGDASTSGRTSSRHCRASLPFRLQVTATGSSAPPSDRRGPTTWWCRTRS